MIQRSFLLIWLLLATTTIAHSQHTNRFKEISKKLVAIDSTSNKLHYASGALKKTGGFLVYKMPEYSYHKNYGNVQTYYEDGELKSKQEFDNYGNILSAVFYNSDGTTWWKSETLEIDSDLKDANDFFVAEGHLTLIKKIREYKFGQAIGTMFLKKEGLVSNGKKIGVWKTYDEYGRIEQEVDFDNL